MIAVEERVDRLETAMSHMAETVERTWREIREERLRFEGLMLDYERRAEKERAAVEKDRKDFNKRLAELSDSMGTLVEDLVAPCGFPLARAIFVTEEAGTCAIRIKRKHPARRGEMLELDLLAVGPTKLLIVEVKRRRDAEKAAELHGKAVAFADYFPEYAGRQVLCAVASVYFDPSVIAFLNREKLYGIAMGDETMEVVNLGAF